VVSAWWSFCLSRAVSGACCRCLCAVPGAAGGGGAGSGFRAGVRDAGLV
jgi:hypothetical protein